MYALLIVLAVTCIAGVGCVSEAGSASEAERLLASSQLTPYAFVTGIKTFPRGESLALCSRIANSDQYDCGVRQIAISQLIAGNIKSGDSLPKLVRLIGKSSWLNSDSLLLTSHTIAGTPFFEEFDGGSSIIEVRPFPDCHPNVKRAVYLLVDGYLSQDELMSIFSNPRSNTPQFAILKIGSYDSEVREGHFEGKENMFGLWP